MISNQLQYAVGIFSNPIKVRQALNELSSRGFSMEKVSVITKKTKIDEQSEGVSLSEPALTPSKGAVVNGVAGATTGALTALAGGFAALLIPVIGSALTVELILMALLGSASAGGLVGAVRGWFFPEEVASFYDDQAQLYDDDQVYQGDYLLTVKSTQEEDIRRAESIVKHCGIENWCVFDIAIN
ncbi:MAG: hypothetical protein HC862_25575 [Scytonema sp. RU_4_4]|nr:hypothetical protein [Scytonema sp. RU_4_4]NJR73211.1 hypothetical protein [Scytonema sp. CRU_2_7]